jgi:hypothetical protein
MKRKWDDPLYLVKSDNEWQARLRARQSWYRQYYLGVDGAEFRGRERGNILPPPPPDGLNFLTREIAEYVDLWKESEAQKGAVAENFRLRSNMLSSQPLCFNLFVPLAKDLKLAADVFCTLTNGRVTRVSEILFEYSPGRSDPRYTGDKSAFDVYVRYLTNNDSEGFLGIEVKYHEDLSGKRIKENVRYQQIAEEMGCFKPSCRDVLLKQPLVQIWRDHLLAGSHKIADNYDDAISILLYPSENEACVKAAASYQACLLDSNGFAAWRIEDVVALIREMRPSQWIESFAIRYLASETV